MIGEKVSQFLNHSIRCSKEHIAFLIETIFQNCCNIEKLHANTKESLKLIFYNTELIRKTDWGSFVHYLGCDHYWLFGRWLYCVCFWLRRGINNYSHFDRNHYCNGVPVGTCIQQTYRLVSFLCCSSWQNLVSVTCLSKRKIRTLLVLAE